MPKISAYPAGGAIQAADKFVVARAGSNYSILGSSFQLQSGSIVNGQIVPTVAGGNLTVSIKNRAGNNPSATDPVYVVIGNQVMAITTAFTVIKNAGTNWCNLGGAELAAQEADLFVYIGNNTAVGGLVDMFFSRVPYGEIYSDFSATTTAEAYAAGNNAWNATDKVSNVGRFAATLSAGAGYTWSVPTYTGLNLINRPIRETRILTCLSVLTGFLNAGAEYSRTVKYQMIGRQMFYKHLATSGSTSNSTGFTFTLPFSPSLAIYFPFLAADSGTLVFSTAFTTAGSIVMTLCKGPSTTAATWTNSGVKYAILDHMIPIG